MIAMPSAPPAIPVRAMTRKPARPALIELPVQSARPPAIIMAGGYGSRLKELTRETPKPMIPVAGRPVLKHILDHLQSHGVGQAALSLHYLPEKVTGHFGDGRAHGLDLRYAVTSKNLGNAGGARLASRMIGGDPLFVFSGDVLTDIDLGAMHDHHVKSGSHFTMALVHVENPAEYGVVVRDGHGKLERLVEKPGKWNGPALVNAGVYLMDRVLFDLIPTQEEHDFSKDLVPRLINQGWHVEGYVHTGYWFDMGTPETLAEAEIFLSRK